MNEKPEGTATFHYVIALQWMTINRISALGADGTLILRPGATRTEVLAHLREKIGTPDGCTGLGLITCFELAPDAVAEG